MGWFHFQSSCVWLNTQGLILTPGKYNQGRLMGIFLLLNEKRKVVEYVILSQRHRTTSKLRVKVDRIFPILNLFSFILLVLLKWGQLVLYLAILIQQRQKDEYSKGHQECPALYTGIQQTENLSVCSHPGFNIWKPSNSFQDHKE